MPSTAAVRRTRTPVTSCASTPMRLLDAAERLFAMRGYAATSVRDITREAGCNIAGINYHFGGKDHLYREVFVRRLNELRDQRMAHVEALFTRRPRPSLEDVLRVFADAFLAPMSSRGEGRTMIELMMREVGEPHLPAELFRSSYVEPIERGVAAALCLAEPRLPLTAARRCVRSVIAQLLHEVHAMRRQVPPPTPSDWRASLDDALQHIVRFSAGGIRACSASGLQ